MSSITLDLPWPPSVNAYWDWTPRGLVSSAKAREFHLLCIALARQQCPGLLRGEQLRGPLGCVIDLHPPELKRKRDGDNSLKALFDGMQHAGVYADDSQIEIFTVRKMPADGCGSVRLLIKELAP